jgi:ethanolamine kinase
MSRERSFSLHLEDEEVSPETAVPLLLRIFSLPPATPLTLSPMSGGLTNILTKVTLPAPHNHDVLLRQHGQGNLVERDREKRIMDAIQRPRVYAWLGNGMVYEYFKGRELLCEEIRGDAAVAARVGAMAAHWHTLRPEGLDGGAAVFATFYRWLGESVAGDKERTVCAGRVRVADLREEMASLEGRLAKLASPVVFCHNDLLAGNILVQEGGEDLIFIDFEYSSYNPRGFDLGNHLCEYAGYGLDYNAHYPHDLDRARPFLEGYLARALGRKPTEEELVAIKKEADGYSLVSHLKWGVWGLLRHDTDGDEKYDYLAYADARISQYFADKDKILARIGSID